MVMDGRLDRQTDRQTDTQLEFLNGGYTIIPRTFKWRVQK